MNEFFKTLQQPEYVHVLLNHLPIIGLFVALLGLGAALFLKPRAPLFLTLALVGLMALSVVPVKRSGDRGADRVLAMSDDEGQAYLKYHEQLAQRWLFLYLLTALAAAGTFVVGWKWPRRFRLAASGVLLLGLASLVAGAVIADYGGKIRHREFRNGPPPVVTTATDNG
ncbi:MAG TPA: hypothetical protein PKN95_03480 [Verrucomicrobiota bacterium]|nr:hypothetical protein [Verrucomicrobiota bacterium]HNT14403.1 hypothetical protein [Verrucomicrobiota bacterium]